MVASCKQILEFCFYSNISVSFHSWKSDRQTGYVLGGKFTYVDGK